MSATSTEGLRVCENCGHFETDHKWYAQSEEYSDEERWECRFSKDDDYCSCTVTWSDHNFIDATAAIDRYASAKAKAELEDLKLHDWGDDDTNVLISYKTDEYIDSRIAALDRGSDGKVE